jgi:signal transduction histidine kinase
MALGQKVRRNLATLVQRRPETKDAAGIGPWSKKGWSARLLNRWRHLRLTRQFLLAALLVVAAFLLIGGNLQSRLITQHLVDSSTRVASIYMEGIISPHVQSLTHSRRLLPEERLQLESSIADTGLRTQIQQIKIWLPDGTIAYASDESLIGQQFSSESVRLAASGETVRNVGEEAEHHSEDNAEPRILEIYIPIRDAAGNIVAVGEFYQNLDTIHESLFKVIAGSWVIRVVLAIAAVIPLYMLVAKAERHIAAQRRAVRRHHRRSVTLSRQNLALSIEADAARRRAAQANEELLSRVGADLHDGPVQLLTLAALHAKEQPRAMELIQEATGELRCIASGLILPELGNLTGADVIRLAVARHENGTGTRVDMDVADLPADISHELKACIYRVVQEALRNSLRHAEGRGQAVSAKQEEGSLILRIRDAGNGAATTARAGPSSRLGLLGAQNRVAAFKGTLRFQSFPGAGAEVVAEFPPEAGSSA